ncbi:hypothetical protein KL915_003061 [Ogataea haglerorum]|nr:hypothetical protein KL915_003061 [Ogataea haglerorum]
MHRLHPRFLGDSRRRRGRVLQTRADAPPLCGGHHAGGRRRGGQDGLARPVSSHNRLASRRDVENWGVVREQVPPQRQAGSARRGDAPVRRRDERLRLAAGAVRGDAAVDPGQSEGQDRLCRLDRRQRPARQRPQKPALRGRDILHERESRREDEQRVHGRRRGGHYAAGPPRQDRAESRQQRRLSAQPICSGPHAADERAVQDLAQLRPHRAAAHLFQWLGFVLKELRRRNMKVWLTGHVPPVPKNLHYSCHAKMSVWQHEYRDIIIGSLYGHMNIDHFVPLDSVKSWRTIEKRLGKLDYETYGDGDEEDDLETYEQLGLLDDDFEIVRGSRRYDNAPNGKVSYLEDVRDGLYAKLKGPKKAGKDGERYSFAHVTASVVPTFNPGFRVWEYNVSGLHHGEAESFEPWERFFARLEEELAAEDSTDTLHTEASKDKTIPPLMPSDLPLGPAYTPQLFSPERYTQYYVDLDYAAKHPDWKFEYQVEYSTDDDEYQMDSLLVSDWLRMARKLARSAAVAPDDAETAGAKKLWKTYLNRAFIDTGYQDLPIANK